MNETDLIIVISGSVARGTSRPTMVSWRVSASASEAPESVGKAITEACRKLNSALKEAVK